MRVFRTTLVALAVIVSLQPAMRAQNLAISLFARSLEQLRDEAGIPGLSAVIVQNRRVVWSAAFGMADVERSIDARPDTPYVVGDLTQTFGATLLLQRIDRGDIALNEKIRRWTSMIPQESATLGQVLRHTSTGAYQYDPSRFAAITPVIEYYARLPFRKALAEEILEKLAMRDSVPGHDMEQPSPLDVPFFDSDDLSRYRAVLQRLAVPYRVDIRRRPTRSDYPPRNLTAGAGMIASALDLATFDAALDNAGLLLTAPALAAMRERGGAAVPTGLGWFVQPYGSDKLVWHFGNVPNAFSSLILKVPDRELTLILLANSDGLSAPFSLESGDVTRSLFARAFLRAFLP